MSFAFVLATPICHVFLTVSHFVVFLLDRDLKLISDASVIREMAEKVIADNPKELAAYKDVSCKCAQFLTKTLICNISRKPDLFKI